MIISTTYFDILFSNAKMFTKSLDNLCGGILYTYDSPKTCIMSERFHLFNDCLPVEMGSFDKRPNILKGVDLSIFSG